MARTTGHSPDEQGYEAAPTGTYPHQEVAPVDKPVGHAGVRVDVEERLAFSVAGGIALLLLHGARRRGGRDGHPGRDDRRPDARDLVVMFIAMYFGFTSLTVVQPGETKVLQFLGGYVGTIRRSGSAGSPCRSRASAASR